MPKNKKKNKNVPPPNIPGMGPRPESPEPTPASPPVGAGDSGEGAGSRLRQQGGPPGFNQGNKEQRPQHQRRRDSWLYIKTPNIYLF